MPEESLRSEGLGKPHSDLSMSVCNLQNFGGEVSTNGRARVTSCHWIGGMVPEVKRQETAVSQADRQSERRRTYNRSRAKTQPGPPTMTSQRNTIANNESHRTHKRSGDPRGPAGFADHTDPSHASHGCSRGRFRYTRPFRQTAGPVPCVRDDQVRHDQVRHDSENVSEIRRCPSNAKSAVRSP